MGDIEAPVIRVVSRLAEYDAGQWDACANPETITRLCRMRF